MTTSGFPNMFMILGPNGPFTNLPPTIETQVEWIADAIGHVSRNRRRLDRRHPGGGVRLDRHLRARSPTRPLFPKVDSWIFGANIPGKKQTVMFYLGGIRLYRELLAEVAGRATQGFVLTRERNSAGTDALLLP